MLSALLRRGGGPYEEPLDRAERTVSSAELAKGSSGCRTAGAARPCLPDEAARQPLLRGIDRPAGLGLLVPSACPDSRLVALRCGPLMAFVLMFVPDGLVKRGSHRSHDYFACSELGHPLRPGSWSAFGPRKAAKP